MRRISSLIIIFFLFSLIQCKGKKEKIEIAVPQEITNAQSAPDMNNNNGKLTPELFFQISIEVNRISKKYQKPETRESTEVSNSRGLEKEIRTVYQRYHITEDYFNSYSENHFRELENYLSSHPDVEQQLH